MVCFLTGYASCAASASLPAWLAHLLSAVSAASACERTALNCNKTSVFSRVQARSAPRAHVRELLCVSQSSKERLRRSRTESSGAAPAIEELAGEARQVRPAGPRADQYQPGSDFSRAQEVWRAPGPPVPPSNIFSQKISLPPSPNRPHTAEVGNSRVGTAFLHPKRSGGRPALQFPRATFSHRRSVFRPNPDHMLQGGKEKKRRTGNSDATPLIRWGGTPLRLSPA